MKFDVVIIGSGPGGYVCAIRCAQLGMKTAIIEKDNSLGGTCLNVGCIPSKALLDSSEHYHNAVERFSEHGIDIGDIQANFKQMIARKDDVVKKTVQGVEFLMGKNKIEVIRGIGTLKEKNVVSVTKDKEVLDIEADKIVLATGSEPTLIPAFNYDGKRIITSTEALELKSIPKSMTIIGGGVIGLELGSVYARLGTKVSVIEFQDRLIPNMDKDLSKELRRSLKKLGMEFLLSHKVVNTKATRSSVTVEYQAINSDETQSMKVDYCLVAIGRRPFTENLGLENLGITTDDAGRIKVDDHLRTSVPNIYAIGDVIRGDMLAHKAEDEGMFVAETMNGEKPHIDYNLIPGVVYTWPEVAAVGQTEGQLKADNVNYKVGKFPMRALGRSRASMDVDGMVKILAHGETDEILGVHMIGARAADMIMEAVALMEFRASAEDLARICHPHPTYTEAIKEAALDATGKRAIHS